ncbi:MAG: adenylyltransferase/cytidyltransferase family protein, partial [Peptococcaceae bacterium]|nr:adenylyltransferase/cytidyltransferase family protein [Peptococcaceae bacterium]
MSREPGKVRRLGIMGGTFDPIHYGHLVTAEGARYELDLDKVVFVPAGRPPHKPDYRITEPRLRYVMTALAVASNPFFEASSLEVERPGPSYTIDT